MKKIVLLFTLALTALAHAGPHSRSIGAIDHDIDYVMSREQKLEYLADLKAQSGHWSLQQANEFKLEVVRQAQADLLRLKAELEAQKPKGYTYKPDAYDKLRERLTQ